MGFYRMLRVETLALLLTVSNLLDLISTLWALKLQAATELNPLLGALYQSHPMAFILFKVNVVLLAVTLLGRFVRPGVAKAVLLFGNLVYLGILGVHVVGWINFLTQ